MDGLVNAVCYQLSVHMSKSGMGSHSRRRDSDRSGVGHTRLGQSPPASPVLLGGPLAAVTTC